MPDEPTPDIPQPPPAPAEPNIPPGIPGISEPLNIPPSTPGESPQVGEPIGIPATMPPEVPRTPVLLRARGPVRHKTAALGKLYSGAANGGVTPKPTFAPHSAPEGE